MRLTRIAPGHYELRVGDGPLDRYEVELHDAGYGPGWFLTYPGELHAGDVCETLQAARQQIAADRAA